jgi:hexokinase
MIDKIYKSQMNDIKKKGNDKAPQIAIIMDDCIGNSQFMKHKAVIRSFIASRHANCTTFICAQHFRKIEKVNRLQASFLFFFPLSQSSLEVLAEEYCPANMNKKQFISMITDSLSEPFSFLTINMKVPEKDRFRSNLDHVLNLDYYKQLQP